MQWGNCTTSSILGNFHPPQCRVSVTLFHYLWILSTCMFHYYSPYVPYLFIGIAVFHHLTLPTLPLYITWFCTTPTKIQNLCQLTFVTYKFTAIMKSVAKLQILDPLQDHQAEVFIFHTKHAMKQIINQSKFRIFANFKITVQISIKFFLNY